MSVLNYYSCYSCGKVYSSLNAPKQTVKIADKRGLTNKVVSVCCNRKLRNITPEDFKKISRIQKKEKNK